MDRMGATGASLAHGAARPDLSGIDALRKATPATRRRIEDACDWRRLTEGARIGGALAEGVWFVVEGRLKAAQPLLVDGANAKGEVGPGGMIGALEALDGGSFGVATAVTDALVASVSRAAFVEIVRTSDELSVELLRRFAALARRASVVIEESRRDGGRGPNPAQRICRELLRLAAPDAMVEGNWVVTPAPLHRDLADWSGASLETVAQTLAQLIRSDVLRRRNSQLIIVDRRRLEALANQI